jgi:8-oxo-dGTP diphosphatase
MEKIAAIILENDNGELLLYLRDEKPGIPFPHHWDLIGGHVEEGETTEQALFREVKEELNYDLVDYKFF